MSSTRHTNTDVTLDARGTPSRSAGPAAWLAASLLTLQPVARSAEEPIELQSVDVRDGLVAVDFTSEAMVALYALEASPALGPDAVWTALPDALTVPFEGALHRITASSLDAPAAFYRVVRVPGLGCRGIPAERLAGTQYALARVFVGDPFNFETMQYNEQQVVCLTNLGVYDQTGQRVGDNNGMLNGRYFNTDVQAFDLDPTPPNITPPTRAQALNHDFTPIDYTGATNNSKKDGIVWASEISAYYHINEFREKYFNDEFIDSLHLDPQIVQNLKYLQYRPDLELRDIGGQWQPVAAAFPEVTLEERINPLGLLLFPNENVVLTDIRSREGTVQASLPLLSGAFAKEELVGDYAGLLAFWMISSNRGFPSEAAFSTTDNWLTNVLPAVNDGLSTWVSHRISGNPEVHRYLSYLARTWQSYPCGGTSVACDKGQNIRNVMMFDEGNITRDSVFPFSDVPGGATDPGRPQDAAKGGMFIAAIFYDIANEVGLGVQRTDQLLWKAVSLIDDSVNFPMRAWGEKIMQAARELWPAGPGASLYEAELADVLTSRGIPVYGVSNFRDNLPPAIGPTVRNFSFASDHPSLQPGASGYGLFRGRIDEYYAGGQPADYVAYQIYRHSKYGPCDYVEFHRPEGELDIQTIPSPNTLIWRGEDRQIGNKVVFVPSMPGKPNGVRFVRIRKRCDNEAEGFYAEDVSAFGFRVIKATPNGFSFTVKKISELSETVKYELTIFDPSTNNGATSASYNWNIKTPGKPASHHIGNTIIVDLAKPEPVTIHLERSVNGSVDELTINDRTTDLDRDNGRAFIGSN